MKIFNIAEHKVLLCCAGILAFGTCSGHAVYPSEGILWRHLCGNNNEGRTIPDAYKQLSNQQKRFEEKEKNGMLSDAERKNRLRFLWEHDAGRDAFGRSLMNAEAFFEVGLSCKDLEHVDKPGFFETGMVSMCVGRGIEFPEWKDTVTKCEALSGGKPLLRFLRVVGSEAFLSRILGEDVFWTFVGSGVVGRGKIIFSCRFETEIYRRFFAGETIGDLSDEALLNDLKRLIVTVHIMQWSFASRVSNEFPHTDFNLSLRLTWNALNDEIEKVELYDDFVVNRSISRFRSGFTIFEKK